MTAAPEMEYSVKRRTREPERSPADIDPAALAVDAEDRLRQLREQRQRLALDALVDPMVAAELADVEAEIATAERAIERAMLAGQEKDRRQHEAAENAAREAREAAAARVVELTAALESAGRRVDAAFSEAATAVLEWLALGEERDRNSVAAGRRPGANAHALRAIQLDGAFRFATRGLPVAVLALEGFVQPRSLRPLVEKGEGEGHGNDDER